MEQVVYADVLWLIDFSMDLLALGIAGRMSQRPVRGWRLCTAAALGGVWSVMSLFLPMRGTPLAAVGIAVAAGMVLLAFGAAPPLRFALTLGGFCLASLLLGGSMTALVNLFAEPGGQNETVSGGGFFLLALAGSGITLLFTRLRRRSAPQCVTVILRIGARSASLSAMTDSGNLLRDPVTGRCVIFVTARRLRGLLDEPLRGVLLDQRLDALTALPPAAASRLCLVPAETVQGRGLLIALRPDAVSLGGADCSALICPTPTAGGVCEAIVPASLLADLGIPADTTYINGRKS